jgi:hypothetical protein
MSYYYKIGTRERKMKLLNIDKNAKTVKGQKKGYMTAILYLAPAKESGFEVCPMSTAGCRAACLYTAGRGAMGVTQKARIAKTRFFFEHRAEFMLQLAKEIYAFKAKAEKAGLIPCVRLNGTSDIVWEAVKFGPLDLNIMDSFSNVQFYDYTKRHNRTNLPRNYHLTYSLAENNDALAYHALNNGMAVAAVFRSPEAVQNYIRTGYTLAGCPTPVVDGDESDLRFLDGRSVIVGLYAKGKARKDTSGFVRD